MRESYTGGFILPSSMAPSRTGVPKSMTLLSPLASSIVTRDTPQSSGVVVVSIRETIFFKSGDFGTATSVMPLSFFGTDRS